MLVTKWHNAVCAVLRIHHMTKLCNLMCVLWAQLTAPTFLLWVSTLCVQNSTFHRFHHFHLSGSMDARHSTLSVSCSVALSPCCWTSAHGKSAWGCVSPVRRGKLLAKYSSPTAFRMAQVTVPILPNRRNSNVFSASSLIPTTHSFAKFSLIITPVHVKPPARIV